MLDTDPANRRGFSFLQGSGSVQPIIPRHLAEADRKTFIDGSEHLVEAGYDDDLDQPFPSPIPPRPAAWSSSGISCQAIVFASTSCSNA